ncbi:ABC transporter substrate-binding protein [Tepiditoga spiralis]|uniref:ABC transporter substrate-binding protein n=1 Tax=Tepiditoga spiralis TaxID=2108365 RepID=A0A7G1G9H9_9BACT|nr:ABC transporter substrate-binding protein [Tepiditoga spiralis]BBE31613.1 ABC transporter substrate-binding protein [Tepiditoga spiralis]
MKKVLTLFMSILVISVFGLEIIDDAGYKIVFDKPFKRIISLYGAHTEVLYGLGLDKEIIGVSKHESYPPEALKKPTFSYRDDAEKFISANPDLVILRPAFYKRYGSLIKKLKDYGITVVALQPLQYKDLFNYWKKIGVLTGKEKNSKRMIDNFKIELKKIQDIVKNIPKAERKNIFFESGHKKFLTCAPNSMADTVLKTIGVGNIAKDAILTGSTVAQYKKEMILDKAKKIDFYIAQKGAMNKITLDKIYKESGFEAIKAIKEKHVYIIDEKIVSRPTPRLILGMKKLGEIIYPKYFKNLEVKNY